MILAALLFGALALACWLTAFASGLELVVMHRRADRSLAWYLLSGIATLDPDAYAPSGARAHQRGMIAIGCFFLSAMLAFVFGVVASAP